MIFKANLKLSLCNILLGGQNTIKAFDGSAVCRQTLLVSTNKAEKESGLFEQ